MTERLLHESQQHQKPTMLPQINSRQIKQGALDSYGDPVIQLNTGELRDASKFLPW